MLFRRPTVHDVVEVTHLINRDSSILPRSQHYVFENLRDFILIEDEGQIIGCGSLHILWGDMAEIRAVTFADMRMANNGLFQKLIEQLLDEGRQLGVQQVFALTQGPEPFIRYGFKQVERTQVQRVVWNECINCVQFPDCTEVPVIFDLNSQNRGITS